MMLEDFGLEPERFRIEWIASSGGPEIRRRDDRNDRGPAGPGPEPVQHQGINERICRGGSRAAPTGLLQCEAAA